MRGLPLFFRHDVAKHAAQKLGGSMYTLFKRKAGNSVPGAVGWGIRNKMGRYSIVRPPEVRRPV